MNYRKQLKDSNICIRVNSKDEYNSLSCIIPDLTALTGRESFKDGLMLFFVDNQNVLKKCSFEAASKLGLSPMSVGAVFSWFIPGKVW